MSKYIFITGGVLSSLGKGVLTASVSHLLSRMGYNVTAVKIDPYLNVDAGTMNPYAHGEVFVTEDGGETDLDLGHYERFLGRSLSKDNNITAGKIYQSIIEKERRGDYLGETVQIIPHVTNEIKEKIREIGRSQGSDIVVIEVGGTVGDIEGLPFLEAARQMRLDEGVSNTLYIHVALTPYHRVVGEVKTKPLQHSVQELRRIGIQPDVIIVRSEYPIDTSIIKKISLFTNVPPDYIFNDYDLSTVYELPLILYSQGFLRKISEKLALEYREPQLDDWISFVERIKNPKKKISIYMIGKYTKVRDSYVSIIEALKHASAEYMVEPDIKWIEATDLESGKIQFEYNEKAGYLILPGFGRRGAEGKIKALKIIRENEGIALGICFGLQLMAVEIARNMAGLDKANSTEIDPSTPHPIVDLLEEQKRIDRLGGTMRLGASLSRLVKGSKVYELYGSEIIYERHRHRYEINPRYLDHLEKSGFVVSGYNERGYVDFMEMKDYRFFIGTQAHPEFKSRPLNPSPLFLGFVREIFRIT
ncbi:MAG: CTP synthase [Sulfolobales archaeon]